MAPEGKELSLNNYRDIILATIEYILEKTVHRVKSDQFDSGIEHYEKLKKDTEKHYRKGNQEKLEKILTDLAILPLKSEDVNYYGEYIKEKTGFDIDILENIKNQSKKSKQNSKQLVPTDPDYFFNHLYEVWSPDHKRKVTIVESGQEQINAVTQVSLHFEKAGATIYGVKGTNLDIIARWKDNNTVVIETRKDYVPITKICQQYQSLDDIVRVEFLAN